MSENRKDYGILLTPEIKLHRKYFLEMAKLLGIQLIYKAPLPGKTFDKHGDLNANYYPGQVVFGIFQDHPDQKTLKKMG